jgi:hypothetical protein
MSPHLQTLFKSYADEGHYHLFKRDLLENLAESWQLVLLIPEMGINAEGHIPIDPTMPPCYSSASSG